MKFVDALDGGAPRRSRRCRALAVGVLAIAFHTDLLAAPADPEPGDPPLPLAESTKGMVFSFRASTIHAHPLGHVAVVHGESERLRPVDSKDPRSPQFRSMDSAWVVACHDGTFSIVEDRFLGEDGRPVAVFTERPEAQEAPPTGSVADAVLTRLCAYIGRRVPVPGGVER